MFQQLSGKKRVRGEKGEKDITPLGGSGGMLPRKKNVNIPYFKAGVFNRGSAAPWWSATALQGVRDMSLCSQLTFYIFINIPGPVDIFMSINSQVALPKILM